MLKNIFLKEFQKLKNQFSDEKKVTFVFKGFPHDWLQLLEQDKLLSIGLDTPLNVLNSQRQELIVQFVTTILEGNNKWLTFEEFATIPSDNFQAFTKTIIINNNFFDSYFPLEYEVPAHHIELNQREDESDQDLEYGYLNNYYSSIELSDNGNYFVSYIDEEKYEQAPLFLNSETPLEYESIEDDVPFVEVGAEMSLGFYDLLKSLHQKDIPKEIYLSWINYKNANYTAQINLDKIKVLKNYFPDLKVYRVLKIVPDQLIVPEREQAYLDILKKYWGYNSYRQLRVYKNVDSLTDKKATVNISQMQIIDSIVTQAEQAKYNEDVPDFRDIFVTAPTGAGKSVMFQVPAIYLAEKYNLLTIVISPLIGLMKDQVYNLQEKNVTFSATINSEISPVEKANIAQRIANNEISILYISPETLLSRADITALIGDREIGLFVIDEAHIVTTWGKAFRADYWYLGDYLQKIRRGIKYKDGKRVEETTSKHRFPIATFTATAIYGGIEDMYAETRDSLLLNNPINYFGYVKRDNIHININKVKKEASTDNEYLKIKHTLLLKNIEFELNHGKKVLIYFPLVKSIFNFKSYLETYADQSILDQISEYYGRLKKEEKNENFLRFKDGNSKIMLATKAFGMGIDIPNIDTVIHFAPTGNVCDYVQEIGRAARDLDIGQASFSFLKEDFKHVNRLHGISTLKKSQLIQVMQKILDLYKQRSGQKNARHLLVNAEEFYYIFQGKKDDAGTVNNDQLDNQLKTALLIIEKGFINSPMKYSPIVARPRSIFSVEYFKVPKEQESLLIQQYGKYIEKHCNLSDDNYSSVYKVNLDDLWKELYSKHSFPNFKRLLHEKADDLKSKTLTKLESIFIINLKLNNRYKAHFLQDLEKGLEQLNRIFSSYIIKRKVFTHEDIEADVVKSLNFSSYKSESFVIQLFESITQYENIMNSSSTQRTNILIKNEYRNKTSYKILPSFTGFTNFILNEAKKILHNSAEINQENYLEYYIRKQDKVGTAKLFLVLGIIEMMNLALYEVKGGDHPQIYIRVGSQYQIEKVLKTPKNYRNSILDNVHERHNTSVEMLKFIFENEQLETKEFWNYIEEYFLGELPKEVEQTLEKKKIERMKKYRKTSSGASENSM
ncbi:helicase-related protein [Niallia circulans]|uniref:helicase-related protein n=1 Tax=Niallia circulans TaxID=1397 RepID=UPI0026F0D2B6|nr:helicase-related protein [Niallia circulans]